MEMYKCDICKRINEKPYGRINMGQVPSVSYISYGSQSFDLCEDCYNDLMNCFQAEGENE